MWTTAGPTSLATVLTTADWASSTSVVAFEFSPSPACVLRAESMPWLSERPSPPGLPDAAGTTGDSSKADAEQNGDRIDRGTRASGNERIG